MINEYLMAIRIFAVFSMLLLTVTNLFIGNNKTAALTLFGAGLTLSTILGELES